MRDHARRTHAGALMRRRDVEKKQRSLGREGCRGVGAAGACTEGERSGKESEHERPVSHVHTVRKQLSASPFDDSDAAAYLAFDGAGALVYCLPTGELSMQDIVSMLSSARRRRR